MCYSSHAILEIIHFRYQIRSLKPFIGQHKWIEYNITFQHGNQIQLFPKVTIIEQLMYTFNFPSLFFPYFIHTLCNFFEKVIFVHALIHIFFQRWFEDRIFFWGGGVQRPNFFCREGWPRPPFQDARIYQSRTFVCCSTRQHD